jgi:hypothetical protein
VFEKALSDHTKECLECRFDPFLPRRRRMLSCNQEFLPPKPVPGREILGGVAPTSARMRGFEILAPDNQVSDAIFQQKPHWCS